MAALFYFTLPQSGYFRPIQAVPKDAIYIVETDEPLQTWQTVNQSQVWQYMRRQPYFAQLTGNAESLNALIKKNQQLFDLLGSRTVLASAHMVKLNDYDFLFVVDLGQGGQLRFLESILTQIPLGQYSISRSEYKTYQINQLYDKKTSETIYWAIVENLLLCSYQRSLIDAAIDQKDRPFIADDPYFREVSSQVSNSGLFKLFVQYQQADDYAKAYMPQPNAFVQMLATDLAYSGLAFEINDEDLLLMYGQTSVNDSTESYFKSALLAGRGSLTVQKVLPQRTAYYMSLAFSDFPTFFSNAEKIYSKDAASWASYQKNLKQIEKLLNINIKENFVSWIGEEVTLVQSQPLGLARDDEMAVVFKVRDLDKAKKNLNFISEQIRRKTPAKFVEIDYKGYTINYLSINGFFRILLGKLFAKLDKPYFTVIDDYVVFSNHPQTLKGFIDDYMAGMTLGELPAFRTFFRQFNSSSNIFMYVQTPIMQNTLRGLVGPTTWAEIQQNRKYIVCFSQIGFQFNGRDNVFDTKMACQFDSMAVGSAPVVVRPAFVELDTADLAADPEDEAPADVAIDDLLAEKKEEFYPNGKKKLEVSVRDGFRHGRYIEYHPNGRVKARGNYRNDKQDGVWRFFDQDGKLIRKRKYRSGIEVAEEGGLF